MSVPASARALRRVHALEMRISRLRAEQVHALAQFADACAADADFADSDTPVADAPGWMLSAAQDPGRFGADDLAAWMTWTTHRAEQAVAEATALRDRLPSTLEALGDGRIDYPAHRCWCAPPGSWTTRRRDDATTRRRESWTPRWPPSSRP